MATRLRSSPFQRNSRPNDSESHSAQGIKSRVRRVVDQHPHFRGRTETIHVQEHEGKLVLTGKLPSFYLKQLLQDAVCTVDGISRVENRINVVSCNNLSSE